MTVFAKNPAYGLEFPISQIQSELNNKLTWLGNNNIYGIIFNNAYNGDVIPESWVSNKEYKQVFINDKSTSQIGFYPIDRNVVARYATVQIIVTVNLQEAYGALIRDNERAYLEVQRIIDKYTNISEGGFKRGVQDVFSDFRTDNIKYLDMQPFECFSFEVEIAYNDNLCQ